MTISKTIGDTVYQFVHDIHPVEKGGVKDFFIFRTIKNDIVTNHDIKVPKKKKYTGEDYDKLFEHLLNIKP